MIELVRVTTANQIYFCSNQIISGGIEVDLRQGFTFPVRLALTERLNGILAGVRDSTILYDGVPGLTDDMMVIGHPYIETYRKLHLMSDFLTST